jgi:hypothetical protein
MSVLSLGEKAAPDDSGAAFRVMLVGQVDHVVRVNGIVSVGHSVNTPSFRKPGNVEELTR